MNHSTHLTSRSRDYLPHRLESQKSNWLLLEITCYSLNYSHVQNLIRGEADYGAVEEGCNWNHINFVSRI